MNQTAVGASVLRGRFYRVVWVGGFGIDDAYHDTEWGVPRHDDRTLFEFLILEGAQAGLSWEMILRKREAYRKAFGQFDPKRVAKFDANKIESLMGNEGSCGTG